MTCHWSVPSTGRVPTPFRPLTKSSGPDTLLFIKMHFVSKVRGGCEFSVMELQTRSKRNITRSIEDIGIAFRFYSVPERWRGTFHLYAMARPSGLFGEGQGRPEEYVHLLTNYGIQDVINFDGGYQDENRPYYEAARAAGIHVNNDPNNAIPDQNNDAHLSWLLNALIVIDRAHQRRQRTSVCINCAAGQGRSGTIMAAWMMREAVQSGEAPLDQALNAQAFGSLQPYRLMDVYPIVQQVIAALREQQQWQGLRPSAVESIAQVRLLNRYYEHLIRERNKRKLINNFRGRVREEWVFIPVKK